MRAVISLAAIVALLPGYHCSYVSTLPLNAQGLLNESMAWMDVYYDSGAGYLYDLSAQTALHHETRSSSWYAVGLLARNEGDDLMQAEAIIKNVISGQYKNVSEQWFGDYQQEPEEPYVGSPAYPEKIYGTWDANWRGFIATTFIVALEEFGSLISNETTALMLESLRNATIGDSYRVGGVDGDNLYPAYSNPSLMRAFVSGWTGRKLEDKNMTVAGENYAQASIDLFNRANTLSEFNSGTYTGVSLFALTLWSKYLPETSVMGQYGPIISKYTWEAVAQLWHPQLKNMAGPWDRAYGFDMNRYVSLMALHFWNLIGKDNSSLIFKPRNITSWLAPNISIGAETINETVVGGPAINPDTFNPAVIQWSTGVDVGFITLYATEAAITAVASPYTLNITYPNGNISSIFSFIVSTVKSKPTVTGWDDLQGLKVNVTGTAVDMAYNVSFAGLYGGADEVINDFEFWNFTYSALPEADSSPPNLVLSLTQT